MQEALPTGTSRTYPVALIVLAAVLAIVITAAYFNTFVAYANLWWSDSTYTHGFLVLGISLYLIFEIRHQLLQAINTPCYLMLIPLAGFCLLWLIAAYVDVQLIQMLVFPFILWCGIVTATGLKVGYLLLFPIFYVLFSIPIWNVLVEPLQYAAVAATRVNMFLTGLPGEIVGITVKFSDSAAGFAIARECSGLRFLVASLSLCALYGYIYYDKWRHRILLLIVGALIAMISNWVRVFGVIVIGYMTDMQHSIVEDHQTFGWVIFGLCLIPLFIIAHYIQPSASNETAPNLANEIDDKTQQSLPSIQPLGLSLALATILLGPLVILGNNYFNSINKPPQVSLAIPAPIEPWQGPIEQRYGWKPSYHHATDSFNGMYHHDLKHNSVHIFFYAKQQPGKELIFYQNQLTPSESKQWRDIPDGSRQLNISSGESIKVSASVIKSTSDTRFILSWYNVAGINTTNRYVAKLLQIYGHLTGRQEAALLALSAICPDHDCKTSDETLVQFATKMYPNIVQSLEQAVLSSKKQFNLSGP
ncbi:MAG: exosortase A [Pseudomonadota bacterium]